MSSDDPSTKTGRPLEAVWRGYVRALQLLAGGLLVLVVLITLVTVISRLLGFGALTWSDETARRVLVWMTFVGGALAVANGTHLRIDSLFAESSNTVNRVVAWTVGALSLLFFLLLIVEGSQFAIDNADRATPGMSVSLAWTTSSGAIGGVLFLLAFLGRAFVGEPDPVTIESDVQAASSDDDTATEQDGE